MKEFMKNQFVSLREEIKESKARGFKVTISGILGTPILYYISKIDDMDFVLFALPAIVIVIALQYLAENHAVMRAGTYIKQQIEPFHKNTCQNGICGWEQWLSCDNEFDSRTVDKYLTRSFILTYIVYYIATSYLACKLLFDDYTIMSFWCIVIVYSFIGISFVYFLSKKLLIETIPKPTKCKECPHDCDYPENCNLNANMIAKTK